MTRSRTPCGFAPTDPCLPLYHGLLATDRIDTLRGKPEMRIVMLGTTLLGSSIWPRMLARRTRGKARPMARTRFRPLVHLLESRMAPAVICYWLGGVDSNWSSPDNWQDSIVPTTGDDVVVDSFANLGYNPVCDAATGSVSVGTLSLWNGASLTVSGVTFEVGTQLDNQGTIVVQAAGTFTASGDTINLSSGILDSSGAWDVYGSSTIDLQEEPITTNAATILLDSSGQFLSGSGSAATNLNSLAVNAGSITIENSASLSLSADGFDNQGTIQVNSAQLTLSGTGWANTGTINTGTFDTLGASTINLGGSFSSSALGSLDLSSATVNLTGTMTIPSGSTLVMGSQTGGGSWYLDSGTIQGGTLGADSGTLVATANGGWLNAVTLTFAWGTNPLDMQSNNGCYVDITGNLTLDGATISVGNGANTGHLYFQGGTQTLDGSPNGGNIELFNGSSLELKTSSSSDQLTLGKNLFLYGYSGTIDSQAGKLVNQGLLEASSSNDETLTLAGANWTNDGRVATYNSSRFTVTSAPTNLSNTILTGGIWEVHDSSTLDLKAAEIATNAATIVLDTGGQFLSGPASTNLLYSLVVNDLNGHITMQNADFYFFATSFSNRGTMTVAGNVTMAAALANSGTLTVDPLYNLYVSGELTNTGTLSMGDSSSVNVASLDSSGTLGFEFGDGGGHGVLAVAGQAALSGTLKVTLGNYAPTAGTTITILTFGTKTGNFSTLTGMQYGVNQVLTPTFELGNVPPGLVLTAGNVVTSKMSCTSTGLLYSRMLKMYVGTLTLTNKGTTTITGPIRLIFANLASGVTLNNASGTTANGEAYIMISPPAGELLPGQSVKVSVQFINPGNKWMTYNAKEVAEPV